MVKDRDPLKGGDRPQDDQHDPSWWRLIWAGLVAAGVTTFFRCLRRISTFARRENPEETSGEQAAPIEQTARSEVPVESVHPQPREVHYADGRIEHPSVQYESRDVKFWQVLAALVLGACLLGLNFYLVFRFFRSQEQVQEAVKRSSYPLAPTPSSDLPPEPRLEPLDRMAGIEKSNVFRREAAAEKLLHSYGRSDEQGFVHIPIEQAMKQLAGKLPERKKTSSGDQPGTPEASKDNGLLDAGEPNSGRILREEPRN